MTEPALGMITTWTREPPFATGPMGVGASISTWRGLEGWCVYRGGRGCTEY